jgi:hypothetical protein
METLLDNFTYQVDAMGSDKNRRHNLTLAERLKILGEDLY